MIRIAAVVVVFNPQEDVVRNLNSYLDHIEELFIVDNSAIPDQAIIRKITNLKKITYKWNGNRFGIAGALNLSAELARNHNYDFLLMMDQDSTLSETAFEGFSEFLSNHSTDDVGILYPYHVYKNYKRNKNSTPYEEILVADTSGSLLNLHAFNKVGPFLEKLFIDYVDFEYCLRLRLNGYKIIQLNTAVLYQKLGNSTSKRILCWKVGVTNHSAQRIYYRVRNRLFVSSKYFHHFPIWSIKQMAYLWIECGKVILFESDKILKCKMILKGCKHYLSNNYRVLLIDKN